MLKKKILSYQNILRQKNNYRRNIFAARIWMIKYKNISMKTEDSLYVKILKLAYERQEVGLSQDELTGMLEIASATGEWFAKIFTEESLLKIFTDKDFKHRYVITSKGIFAYNDSLNLQETNKIKNKNNVIQEEKGIFELKPNFYGVGIDLKKAWVYLINKYQKLIKIISGFPLRRLADAGMTKEKK